MGYEYFAVGRHSGMLLPVCQQITSKVEPFNSSPKTDTVGYTTGLVCSAGHMKAAVTELLPVIQPALPRCVTYTVSR